MGWQQRAALKLAADLLAVVRVAGLADAVLLALVANLDRRWGRAEADGDVRRSAGISEAQRREASGERAHFKNEACAIFLLLP